MMASSGGGRNHIVEVNGMVAGFRKIAVILGLTLRLTRRIIKVTNDEGEPEMYVELAKEIIAKGYIVGVRSLEVDENYAVGDECRESYEWDVENDCSTYHTTGETADGTCATLVEESYNAEELAANIEKTIVANKVYGGKQVIIAGHSVNNDGMFDPGEVRIRGAVVIAVVA